MRRYVVYGAGSPIEVDTYHPEIAEAIVVEEFGVPIERITVRVSDVVLFGSGDS
jgi:hypothetical protein